MKRILAILAFFPLAAMAQDKPEKGFSARSMLDDIEIGGTAGSTGVGFDLKTTVAPNLSMRVGFNYMPRITRTSGFTMASVSGVEDESMDQKTAKLAEYLGKLIGNDKVDNVVDMKMEGKFFNAKILFDWSPLRNKHWHFTAGIYVGTRHFAKACNTIEEGPTTTAMRLYNNMYDQIQGLDEYEYPVFQLGTISFELDPISGQAAKAAFARYGRVGVQIGTLANGDPYTIEPDEDALLRAEGYYNKVKPYVGFGYNFELGKDQRWNLGLDAGALYWGTPHIYHHSQNAEGEDVKTCLIHDVRNIRGIVGSYVNLAQHLAVYPVAELRLAYHLK